MLQSMIFYILHISKSVFVIVPAEQDIPPLASVTFRVSFRPRQPCFYYAERLQAYVYFKTNRTFRLVDPEAFVPPFCIKRYTNLC